MSLIPTITPESAEGEMKTIYQMFIRQTGQVPKPLEMFSISPELFSYRAGLLKLYSNNEKLTFPLLTLIRYLVANDSCNHACTSFNGDLIKRQGMSDEDINKLVENPLTAPLEDDECQLLNFVVKAIRQPESVTKNDLEDLHNYGWEDKDIFEALSYGTDMIGPGIMMKALKMD